jgi:phage shock protein A
MNMTNEIQDNKILIGTVVAAVVAVGLLFQTLSRLSAAEIALEALDNRISKAERSVENLDEQGTALVKGAADVDAKLKFVAVSVSDTEVGLTDVQKWVSSNGSRMERSLSRIDGKIAGMDGRVAGIESSSTKLSRRASALEKVVGVDGSGNADRDVLPFVDN